MPIPMSVGWTSSYNICVRTAWMINADAVQDMLEEQVRKGIAAPPQRTLRAAASLIGDDGVDQSEP